MNEKLLNKIITVAYGDANFFDQIFVRVLALKNNEVKSVFNEYSLTAKEVKNLKQKNYNVKTDFTVVINKTRKRKTNYNPAFAVLSAVIIVSLITVFIFNNTSTQTAHYSNKEIDLAKKQVEKSLFVVSRILNATEKTVTEDIIIKKVSNPIRKRLSILNDLLSGG